MDPAIGVSGPNVLVTIKERKQNEQSGKWSYKVADSNDINPIPSDGYVEEERLSNSE
jgi:hypothetical protein